MINLSQKNVVKIAKETNFIKDNVEKVMRLAGILEFVFTSKWKDKLALKGGTAINLFYRELPRLSVDIDLDYIRPYAFAVVKIFSFSVFEVSECAHAV